MGVRSATGVFVMDQYPTTMIFTSFSQFFDDFAEMLTDGPTVGRTERQIDGWADIGTDGRTYKDTTTCVSEDFFPLKGASKKRRKYLKDVTT